MNLNHFQAIKNVSFYLGMVVFALIPISLESEAEAD